MALLVSLRSKKVVAPIPQLGDGTVGPGLVRELDSHLQCDDRPRKDGRPRLMGAISGYLLSLPLLLHHQHPPWQPPSSKFNAETIGFISAPPCWGMTGVVASWDNGGLRLTLTIGHLPRLLTLRLCPPVHT